MTCADPVPPPDLERESLIELLQRVRPRLKRVLKSYDIPFTDAEDLVQETVLEALRKWDTIRHLEPWLVGTLRFKCSNYWKRQRSEREQAMDLADLEDFCEPQPPAQERDEIRLDLRSLGRGLGPQHRAILWLRFGLGLSADEVAAQLGYCPSSIRKLIGRSMARLQRWLASSAGNAGIPGGRPDGSD